MPVKITDGNSIKLLLSFIYILKHIHDNASETGYSSARGEI